MDYISLNYNNMTIFKMVVVRHFECSKFDMFVI